MMFTKPTFRGIISFMYVEGEGLPNPQDVFEPAYWGEVVDREPVGKLVLPWKMREAGAHLASLAPKIISGDITGQQMPPGVVYNPEDPDLAASSIYNFPGSVLLLDYERLRDPMTAIDGRGQRVPDNPDDPAILLDSPRARLLRHLEVHPGVIVTDASWDSLQQDGRIYDRRVYLITNCPARKAVVSIKAISTVTVDQGRSSTHFLTTAETRGCPTVNQTYRSAKPGHADSLTRIRSLELCASGEPALAQSPSRAKRFLGNLATGSQT